MGAQQQPIAQPQPAPRARPAPRPAPVQQQRLPAPEPQFIPDYDLADEAGTDPKFNPFINPFDQSHNNAGFLAGQRAAAAQQPARRPAPIQNARPTGRVIAQPQQPARPLIQTTPSPKRFFPPGQIKLNRFETGFNFDFES